MKTMTRTVVLCFGFAALATLTACSGGMSAAQVEQELKKFCGEIDQTYTAAGSPPHGQSEADMLQYLIDMETAQLLIVDKYLAANTYPNEVQQHLTDMKDGLTQRINIVQSWVDNGLTRDTAPASEVAAENDAAMKSTYADTQLRIAAGL
jgi:hypothetical protein